MADYPYTKEELYEVKGQRSYSADATEAKFLLGGIGTGNVSVGSRGQFCDWEIFNSPGRGNYLPYTFFAIWAKEKGRGEIAKVLESRLNPPFNKSHGFTSAEAAGLARFESSSLKGEYPFVFVNLEDKEMPVKVSLEAFTPFIPLNADDSGIPGAVIRYRVKNISDAETDVTIAGSLANVVGFDGYDEFNNMKLIGEDSNTYRDEGDLRGLFYTSNNLPHTHLKYGSMAILTGDRNVTYKTEWLDGIWWDAVQDFWDDFSEDGRLEVQSKFDAVLSKFSGRNNLKIGTLGINHMLKPGEEKVFEFIVTWHFPNRIKGWYQEPCSCGSCGCGIEHNYYSTLFVDAWDAGRYMHVNLGRLEKQSRDFHDALFGSTLPSYVLDAISSNITVLRSTTCFRIENGTFLGWEGCFDGQGCCDGTCTHVWNYAQTLAFLFPELERSMRRVEFNMETDKDGKMAFRTRQVFGGEKWDMLPAADGQMGSVIRVYREWKLSGDSKFLKELWPNVTKALDFAFTFWDTDGDFVLDSQQHNTYDIEFYGPNSLTNSMFFSALKAGSNMAEYLGDEAHAQKYREALKKGSARMDEMLWGGEYYIQSIDDVNRYRYQYGSGCLSDQLLGQFLAHVTGLGYILPTEHVKKAVYSIYKYNFRDSFLKHNNVQRTYVLNDEKGLLLCSWPYGGRPRLPFVYSDEVWTGIEYQVAATLIYEGFLDEGLTIVKAVRDRHDGYRRNPWNEVECGNHYARSMSSWALLLALSGFKYDMVKGEMSFDPAINKDEFSTFWSTGKAWGTYSQVKDKESGVIKYDIKVLYGNIDGIKVN